jgi:hypothetical protein
VKRGILKPERVFGNQLENQPTDDQTGMPEFLVRCVAKIEKMAMTEGIYRVNGDAAIVQKMRLVKLENTFFRAVLNRYFRLEINKEHYKLLDSTNDANLLARKVRGDN